MRGSSKRYAGLKRGVDRAGICARSETYVADSTMDETLNFSQQ